MSSRYWQDQLKNRLNQAPVHDRPLRIALVGVGNALRGDDAVGVVLVRKLNRAFGDSSAICIVEAGVTPENITGELRHFRPDFILFIDAAQMNEIPGRVRVWSYADCIGNLFSTHGVPLNLLCAYLEVELNCQIAILGIQPFEIGFCQGLSKQITKALEDIVSGLVVLLNEVIGYQVRGAEEISEFTLDARSGAYSIDLVE